MRMAIALFSFSAVTKVSAYIINSTSIVNLNELGDFREMSDFGFHNRTKTMV